MAQTFATSPADGSVDDITGAVVDGIEALRQRVAQRLRFRRGTWVFDPGDGVPSIVGHEITVPVAERVITDAIRDEGGDEILTIDEVTVSLDRDTRLFRYAARVVTIYGGETFTGSLDA